MKLQLPLQCHRSHTSLPSSCPQDEESDSPSAPKLPQRSCHCHADCEIAALMFAVVSKPILPLLAHAALGLALLLYTDVDHRVDGGALANRERKQLMRQDAKLMEGVIGIVRFAIALVN
ncbi:hypothetical protein ABEW50_06885 [Paenibacillus jamilae]